MINIKELQNRLDWLNKNLPILNDEKAALEMMLNLYNSPEYHALRAIQGDLTEPPAMVAKAKAKPPTVDQAMKALTSTKDIRESRTDGTYTTKKFFEFCKNRPEFTALIRSCFKDYVKIIVDGPTAKELGLGSATLGKLLRTAVQRGWLIKHTTLRATYTVPTIQITYLNKHLPKQEV